jgi:hypothetical protein
VQISAQHETLYMYSSDLGTCLFRIYKGVQECTMYRDTGKDCGEPADLELPREKFCLVFLTFKL